MNAAYMSQYNAYKLANTTVKKTKQIVMLYEGAMKFILLAREAIGRGDIEQRFKNLEKASDILIGLQNALDYDRGGAMAEVLYDFYSDMLHKLNRVHETNNASYCQQAADDLKTMLASWQKIDAQDEAAARESARPAGGGDDSVTLSA